MGRSAIVVAMVVGAMAVPDAWGQVSSIGARQRRHVGSAPSAPPPREAPAPPVNAVYEQHAWITAPPRAPRTYRVNDLITIIVRHRRQWEADADLNSRREWELSSELDAFLKATGGGIGASAFRRGKPNIDFKWENEIRNRGDSSREDSLTTRITTRILDVKPNGLLVLEGRSTLKHDDEASTITITGSCRKQDVTADNTVLSTQVADLNIVIDNEGALRRTMGRGWIPKLLDILNPF